MFPTCSYVRTEIYVQSRDTELRTTLAPDLWSAWVTAEQSRNLGCTCKAPEPLLSSQPPGKEAPSETHYTAGQEQHLKCTSLNGPLIFLSVALPEDSDHLKQMASLLSRQVFHQDPHHYSGSKNVSHFLSVSQSEIVQYWISHTPTLRKQFRYRVLEHFKAIVRNGNITEKQEM